MGNLTTIQLGILFSTLSVNLIKVAAVSIDSYVIITTDSKYVEPIHFIDASGEEPSKELDIRSIVQDKLAVWVYHDLAVTKVE